MAKNSIKSIQSPTRILQGWTFAFFFAALLSASVVSYAAIVGTDNFEEGGKTGWDWDRTGTAQEWSVSSGTFTREVDGTGNTRAKVNGQTFLGFGTSNQLTSGTFVYTFDMEIGTADNQWGGLSLYNGGSEMNFFGNLAKGTNQGRTFDGTRLSLRNVPTSNRADDESAESYLNTNKTYAVVANSSGMFAWAYDLGTKPKYEDLYTTPTVKVDKTLGGNNRFRLGTNGTMYFDNIKMAYSDSSTVASKGDATAMSSLTDIFGAAPTVTTIKESFSKYESGAIVGQLQKNLGQAPVTKWTGITNVTVDNTRNLEYPGWSSEQGVLNVSGEGTGAVMTLDYNVMSDWGVMGTDSLIGGAGVSNNTLYYGFLMQSAGDSGRWNMGAELYRGTREVLGMSYHDWTSYDNMAGVFYNSNDNYNDTWLNFVNDAYDNDTHLFVVKLTYGEDGVGDDALIFIDPNMSLSEDQQDSQHIYRLSEMVGSTNLDLTFDSIHFRGARAFTFDEWRMSTSWLTLADEVGEPYYYANTADISTSKWTIDGSSKMGVKFIEGDQNTAMFANPVELTANGSFEIGQNRNLTVSGVISGNGGLEKTGAGTLTLSGANTYTGETMVSNGTLLVPSSASLKTSQVTVTTDGTFQTGVNLEGVPVNLDGGTLVIGDSTVSTTVMIGALTLTGGTICFDFNDCTVLENGYNVDTDWLKVSSASLTSGVIDLSFHGSSAEDWWDVIKNNYSENGFEIITGTISDIESFNSNSFTVSVNGTPSDSWTLTATSGGLYLFATEYEPEPEPGNVWYDANTSDIDLLDWTIDGTTKVGAKFIEGGDSATFSGSVSLTGAGEFKIGTGQNLTLSEAVTGSGDLKKTGEGILTLSQAPGYTGSTAVETGTLVLSAGGTLNNLSGAGTVDNSGKALTLNNTSNSEFSGIITGAGAVTKSGSGTLELSGENTYTGATTVSAGELVFSGSVLPVSAMKATGGALVLGTEGNAITVKRGASITASGGAVRVDGDLVFEAPGSGFVACDGSWTGNGSIKLDGGYIRVGTNFNTTTGINFNGGSILNNNNDGILTSDLTITKDGSTMQAGWSKSLTLKGALKGNASLTVGSDSGWLIFSGNGSAYQGSLLVKGQMRVGVANTDSSDVSQYIGGKVINLNGGTIQNNNNNITFTNDLNVMTETGFKAGWSKSITLTGNVTGSAKLKLVSDSGWLILKTHSDNDAFTGPFQTGWASTSSRGQTRLAAEQPLGANVGILYNYGYLDMNGYSQKFKGVVDDGANNKKGRIYNTTDTKSVVTFDITNQNLSYAGTIESNVELIVNASGEGVQTFTNGGSSFTGNATINGGKIRMTGKGSSNNSPIGKVSNTRYVYVNDGGELVFANQDVLANAHNYAPINFVVNGGKISNEGANYNFLQNTTFKNGGQLYASDGNATWKAFKLLNVTVARNDDDTAGAPVLFSSDPSKPDATIAFGDISSVIKEGNSVSTVKVAEITSANSAVNDNVSDLVISAVITDPTYQTDGALKHSTQIIKTGAGTMELTAANTITGKTTISEGAIKLSGSGTLGSGAVENNGTLEFAHESDQTFSNAISGTGDVVKSGSGTLTISNNNYSYTGETTVSGGTLLVTSAGSLSTSKVTVASATAATFQTGANLNGIAFELGQGGTLVVGETSASSEITIGALTFSGGTISFDFNDVASESADWLKVSSASMNSGVINLTFNTSSEDDWWNVIDSYADGFPIITGTITNYESFNPSSVKVAVNGTVSSDWKLTAANDAILLMTSNDEPVSEPWYYANTSDISLQNWTIDGTNKLGAKFTEGGDAATFEGGVALNANGVFEIGTGHNLTVSGVISGNGGLEKTGAGALTLSGDNTYTGETKVSAGTLNLTKVGKKGTLATGSVLTVDGASSVVTGHGDIFGYGDETLGTINLTNGGTLHNDSTNAHITVGATINMNNGVISSENGNGSNVFGNYVFDNAINVLGGTDNAITANRITLRYYTSTPGEAGGKITVADGAILTISSRIDDPDGYFVPLVKQGAGTLVLSGDCYYTTGTFVNGGTLQLTKTGQKGTLATGSTVTVDGATSVLAGHGDILGYSSSSVGTVNLQNGGTFYNDSSDAHVTVGAAVNMNNGVITADPTAQGGGEFGNFVFDNAINVTGGTDNAISANRITLRQYDGTSAEEVGGKITVAEGAKLTISSQIMAHNSAKVVPLVKLGAGELVLSGDSTFTTGTFVNEGTLRLTKVGKKGTLAAGSAITVDGAASVLTGHGDIFGYADETVGTINLTNGGKLHNDATNAHVTVGAAVNMNNGVISSEDGAGDNRFGNFVFDNAINVTGGTDNEINANKISLRMYPSTPGEAGGKITVAQDSQLKISSQIIDPDANTTSMVKQGAGTLTLSGDNTYTTPTTVSEGTLQLTGAAVKANSSTEIAQNATLEYNVASGEKSLDFTTSNTTVSGSGNVAKTGAGKLKIKADGTQFSAGQFTVSAGELDFKGQYNGDLFVESGATFSPGNSVGDMTVYGNVTIDAGATGLFEFSPYDEQQYDTLTIDGGEFVTEPNSIIKLFFVSDEDADLWAAALDETGYQLVYDEGFNSDAMPKLENYLGLFALEGRTDGLYLVAAAAPEPGSGVPEPSTWALLILGAAGLLFWRKRK